MRRTRIGVFCLAGFLLNTMADGTQAAPRSAGFTQGPAQDLPRALRADARLSAGVTLSAGHITLAECAAELSRQSRLRITAASDVQERRVNVYVRRLPLRNLMLGIAHVFGFGWQRTTATKAANGALGYRLFEPDGQRTREARLVAAARRFENGFRNAKRKAMLDAIHEELSGPDARADPVLMMLAQLPPADVDRVVGLTATRDSANSGDYEHLAYVRPYAQLPAAIQKALADNYGSGGDMKDVEQCSFGLFAGNGAVRLGIVHADTGRMSVDPGAGLHEDRLAADWFVDMDSDGRAKATTADLLSVDGAPDRTARVSRTYLTRQNSETFEQIAASAGVSIVSDDYVRTHDMAVAPILTDCDGYPLKVALAEVARASQHRIVYEYGLLAASTLTLGEDLYCEPPGGLIHRMQELTRSHQFPELADFLALARLPYEQLETLHSYQMAEVVGVDVVDCAFKMRGILIFYDSLSPVQCARAARAILTSAEMSPSQKRAFEGLAAVGAPAVASEIPRSAPAGFLVRFGPTKGLLRTVTFLVIPAAGVTEARTVRISTRVAGAAG